jgi:hypothetical protein
MKNFGNLGGFFGFGNGFKAEMRGVFVVHVSF